MEMTVIPTTAYVAIGAMLAALIAGFFSFLNLVSAKENKVSEFRLSWIDGLREEIACYTSALQELVRIEGLRSDLNEEHHSDEALEIRERAWHGESREAYKNAIESLTKIQLRLNPKHVKDHPDSPEAALMICILEARENFNLGNHNAAYEYCDDIRSAAAPLLKSTWDLVKRGEPGYQLVRRRAQQIIVTGLLMAVILVGSSIVYSVQKGANNSFKPTPHRGVCHVPAQR